MKNYVTIDVKENTLGFELIEIKEVSLVNSKSLEMYIVYNVLDLQENTVLELEKLVNLMHKQKQSLRIMLEIYKFYKEYSINDIISFLLKVLRLERLSFKFILTNNEVLVDEEEKLIHIKLKEKSIDKIMHKAILDKLYSQLENLGLKYKLEIHLNNEEVKIERKKEDFSEDRPDLSKITPEPKKEENKFRSVKKSTKIVAELRSLDEEFELKESISLIGEVFRLDKINTKNGRGFCNFYITNGRKSIIATKFFNEEKEINFKVGDNVKISGTYDRYKDRDYNVVCDKVELIEVEKDNVEDNSPIKRIELAARTNMSEMISNIGAKELIKKAKNFGSSAIGITDFSVVHAFPHLAKSISDNEDFKILYGVEAFVVDDISPRINNVKDIKIDEEEFVVFDIETTGFSPYKDKIIEIGAVKIKNGIEIDKFSEFINPEMMIPLKIVNITGISDNMVQGALTVEKVLPRFIEFCKGSTLVAHNAKFDIGFISKKAEELGIKTEFSFIDTLELARTLISDVKKYGLDSLSKYFGINLTNHHRAIYDARATSDVFLKLLERAKNLGVEKLEDINTKLKINYLHTETENISILVKNLEGLKSLYKLVSKAHLEYISNIPRMLKSDILKERENLLISSAPAYFGQYNKGKLAELYVRGFSKEIISKAMDFYDYVQIYPSDSYNEAIENEEIASKEDIFNMNKMFVELAKEKNKLAVATSNLLYLNKDDSIIKTILKFSGTKRTISTKHVDTFNYFRTTDEMLQEFNYLDDVENIVIHNTYKIAEQIEKIKPIPDGEFRPVIEGSEETVRKMTYEGAYKKYGNPLPKVVEDRVERELNSIIGNGFSALYLIAQMLVKKSLDNGYLVGSRGSVGSSLVAYFMGITEVNALYPHYICPKCKHFEILDFEGSGVDLEDKNCPKCNNLMEKEGHSIPFEVFMGFKGDKTPDIDLNFSGLYQGEIHKYTKELFGENNVFRAGTVSTIQERNAIDNVRKYFKEDFIKKCEKEVFDTYKVELKKLDENLKNIENIKINTKLEDYLLKNKAEIVRLSDKIVGSRKTTGKHPGGMIVVPNYKEVYDFTPLQYAANDLNDREIITHFDYHVMDTQLVKLDILGHDDPTTLKILQDLTGIDIYTISLTDKKVLSLFSSTEALGIKSGDIESNTGTNGIPEFGTAFVKQMLEDTKPTTFAELVRISGLSHGTDVWLNNAQEYVRNGVATLNEVITVRDDIMNHLIDMKLEYSTAFDIMEFVRKGQPSKNPKKWEEYKKIMKEHNVKEWYIESCEKIKYMFPKGHAVAYVMMAVRIAYFKVYHPLEFYAAYLSRKYDSFSFKTMYTSVDELKRELEEKRRKVDQNASDKATIYLLEILIEMRSRGIELLPVDIYKSKAFEFSVEDGKIRIPLIGMENLGSIVATTIVEEREKGEFTSINNMIKRTKIPKGVISELKRCGCINPDIPEDDQLTLFG